MPTFIILKISLLQKKEEVLEIIGLLDIVKEKHIMRILLI
jgi:hypothetical protein